MPLITIHNSTLNIHNYLNKINSKTTFNQANQFNHKNQRSDFLWVCLVAMVLFFLLAVKYYGFTIIYIFSIKLNTINRIPVGVVNFIGWEADVTFYQKDPLFHRFDHPDHRNDPRQYHQYAFCTGMLNSQPRMPLCQSFKNMP